MTKFDSVKSHLVRNKDRYIFAGVGVTVGVVVTVVYVKTRQIVINDSLNVSINSPKTNVIIAEMIDRSTPSNVVQRVEDCKIWASQNAAAKDLGVHAGDLSRHLRNMKADVNGEHFVVIPRAA